MFTISPSIPSAASEYSASFFGAALSAALYGVTCMQTFFYYVRYQNDLSRTKIFVAILWALNTIHEGLTISGVYKYIMGGLENPYAYSYGSPELVLQFLFTAVVSVSVQGFLVYRIYAFNGKNIIPPIIWAVLAILQCVTVFIYAADSLYYANGVHSIELNLLRGSVFTRLNSIYYCVGAGADIMIAILMALLMFRERTPYGLASTAHILHRVTVFAVNTGIWPAIFALLTITLMYVFDGAPYYVVPAMAVCSVYCNTLLANLNARHYIKGCTRTHEITVELVTDIGSQASKNNEISERCGEA